MMVSNIYCVQVFKLRNLLGLLCRCLKEDIADAVPIFEFDIFILFIRKLIHFYRNQSGPNQGKSFNETLTLRLSIRSMCITVLANTKRGPQVISANRRAGETIAIRNDAAFS